VRVLLDSNVWLAILTTDGFCRRCWREARDSCEFVSSEVILAEIEEKLRLKFGFQPQHVRLLAAFVRRQTTMVNPKADVTGLCRDPDDAPILAAALAANCTSLVTGDQDLLVLQSVQSLAILTPREFADRLAATRTE
jgi:putative PIN family toxin of toxin-antitoxin system